MRSEARSAYRAADTAAFTSMPVLVEPVAACKIELRSIAGFVLDVLDESNELTEETELIGVYSSQKNARKG